MQEPDPDLIRRAQGGDLVRSCQPDVWRVVRAIVRDPHLADDVTQDTFVRAFRFLGSYAFRSKFSTWLFTIARRCSLDALGKRSRIADEEPPEVAVADASEKTAVHAAIDALPESMRQPFLLVEVYGMTCDEAAAVLHVRPGTIKSRMFRARAVLVRMLTDEDETLEEVAVDEM